MTFDATFWVAIAFVAFIALVGKRVYAMITAGLDKRSEAIRTELDEAVCLREEAQALLAGYQRKQRDAVSEAEEILEHAKTEAAHLAEQAEKDLEAALERRIKLAEEKIAQAEAQAVAEVRDLAVDVAIEAARQLIARNLDETKTTTLVDEAIDDLEKKLH